LNALFLSVLDGESFRVPLPPASSASDPLVRRLRAAIPEVLCRGDASLAGIARRMGTSSRTLQRRLQESGVSYTDVVDVVRADLGRRHVLERQLSYAQIASLLGFSQPSAFFRAFRRWTGTTPSVFRGD